MVALQLNKHPEKTAFILKLRKAKQARRKWCDHVCNQNKKSNNYYLKQKVNFVALLFHSRCIITFFALVILQGGMPSDEEVISSSILEGDHSVKD